MSIATKCLLWICLLTGSFFASMQRAIAQDGLSGQIILNRGAKLTNNPEKKVSITVQARGARYMMLSNNGSFIGATWKPYEPFVRNWQLAGNDGRKTVYAQFKDAAGNLSESVSTEIILDRIPPTNPSIVINDGREYTNEQSREVRLDISAGDAFQMRVSNRRDFLHSPWVSYRKRIGSWRLTPNTGVKQVFVQFRDRAGNLTDILYDEITLDQEPPSYCGMEIENGAIYTNKTTVNIKMKARGASEMIFRGGDGWIPFQENYEYGLIGGDGLKEIVAKFRDEAGNQSVVVYDKILLDTQPPVNGKLIINERANFTQSSTNLQLNIFAMGANEMMVSNDPNFTNSRWQPYAPAVNSWEVSPENGEKTIYIKFRDKAGNESEVFSDSIVLDNTPPTKGYLEIVAEDAVYDSLTRTRIIKNNAKVVDLKVKSENANYMMVSNTSTFYAGAWEPYREEVKGWELGGANDGIRYVYVKFRDKAGNISMPIEERVMVDTEPPLDCHLHIEGSDREDIFATDSTRMVELSIFARGAREMMLSNDSTFSSGTWEPYKTVVKWQLSPEDGAKHVYVKFRDLVGNESKIASDGIMLDRKPPFNCSVLLNKGEEATNNIDKVVLLKVTAEEAVSMQISNEPNFSGHRWIGYTALNLNWSLAGNDGTKTVYVRFQDEAGNISEPFSDSIILDRTPPKEGTISINDGETITNNSNKRVTLTLHAEDAKEMRIANVINFEGAEWEPYQENKEEWILSGPDGLKTVFAQFRDSLGNISKLTYDKIGIDRRAPVGGSITIDNGATFCTEINKRVALRLRVREANYMMVSNKEDFSDTDWVEYNPYIQRWVLDGDDGEKTVYVKYKDYAGNETAAQASITLDRQEPVNEKITINGGAAITNNIQQVVALRVEAEGATEMMIGHDKFFNYPSKWEPYSKDVINWTLKGRDGNKTVYVKFRDEAGNESQVAVAEIRLDTEPPQPKFIKINGSKTGTESRLVELSIRAKDANYMMVSESAKFTGASWEPYTASKSWTLSGGPGLKRIFIKFKDDAENESGHIFADITLFGEE